MKMQPVRPSRNFCVLSTLRITDPADGREKAVLSNYVAGGTGNLLLLDPVTGEAEDYTLPKDNGAWGLLVLPDGRLLVSCCSSYGCLHSFDLRTRTFARPLQTAGETYIWNLALASDGCAYGGTYPGCVLLRYDPAAHTLQNLGRVSADPDNLYTRTVYPEIAGRLPVQCGYARSCLCFYDIYKQAVTGLLPGTAVHVSQDAVCMEREGAYTWYDPVSLRMLPRIGRPPEKAAGLALGGGNLLAMQGQEYRITAPGGAERYSRIPAKAPATGIMTIACAADGKVWGSSVFGQTVFCLDPDTGAYENTAGVCSAGGEVYGICEKDGRVFMSAYSGGDHVVYDPAQRWDQRGNRNPVTLRSVKPAYIRPNSGSVIGPDGGFWTGWMAAYGSYGGALSRVDTRTLAVDVFENPVSDQAIRLIAAGSRLVFFVTCNDANGLPPQKLPVEIAGVDTAGVLRFHASFVPAHIHSICAGGERLYAAAGEEDRGTLYLYDADAPDAAPRSAELPCVITAMRFSEALGGIVACGGGKVFLLDRDGAVQKQAETGIDVAHSRLAVSENGRIFAAQDMDVYELTL